MSRSVERERWFEGWWDGNLQLSEKGGEGGVSCCASDRGSQS